MIVYYYRKFFILLINQKILYMNFNIIIIQKNKFIVE